MVSTIPQRALQLSKRLEGLSNKRDLSSIIQKSRAQVMDFEAIPIDQLKGDLARAGHPVKQTLALDVESRRLFFTDVDGQHLYAEFGPAIDNFSIGRIAHQSMIAKEYDVIDLEPSSESGNLGEVVTTTHDEEEVAEEVEPGLIPGGTPVAALEEEDDRGFSSEEKTPARVEKALADYLAKGDEEEEEGHT